MRCSIFGDNRRILILPWATIFLISFALAFFAYAIYTPVIQTIKTNTVDQQLDKANKISNEIDYFLQDEIHSLTILAATANHLSDPDERLIIVKDTLDERPWINWVSIIDLNGNEWVKLLPDTFSGSIELNDLTSRAVFQGATNGKISFSQSKSENNADPFFSIGIPVLSTDDQVTAVLIAEISMEKASQLLANQAKEQQVGVYLINSEGDVIASGEPANDSTQVNFFQKEGIGPAARQVVIGQQSVAGLAENERYINDQGQKRFVVGVPVKSAGWGLLVDKSNDEVWATYRQINNLSWIIGLTIALLVILLVINNYNLTKAFSQLEKTEDNLHAEVSKRMKELKELDNASKLLVRRDIALSQVNAELDKRIAEVEQSRKALMEAYQDISNEKNKNLAIISNITSPILVLNNEHRLAMFNKAAASLLGLMNKDIGVKIAKTRNFRLDNFNKIIRKRFKILKTAKNQDSYEEEIELVSKGETHYLKVLTVSIIAKDTKEYLGVMKLFYDLTREKMIDKMKSDFISIAAHQLRTPLSAIKWILQMIIEGDSGPLTDEQRDLLSKGFKSNERMIELVNDLLNVSRIEEGRFGYDFKYDSIEDTLNMVFENYEKLFAKNHLKITLQKPDAIPPIYMDKSRLVLAFQNVFDNAVKYTPEYGKIDVKILIRGNNLVISVKDSGIGIPDADKNKIFTKFFRATNVLRIETDGTGLGMFIIKNIIDRHGGKISIWSEEGKGTEVSIYLPLKPDKRILGDNKY